jgi:sigma-54-specific transcriptional regulator
MKGLHAMNAPSIFNESNPYALATDAWQEGHDPYAPPKVLTLPNAGALALSIRAKALVFNDPQSQAILQHLERIAPTQATVMIVGETGTGKELVARFIHEHSNQRGPFVAINCGAFSENLVEAELFGHESGAFTGAQQARAGWFEAANGGTLFLDEVGDMPLSLQVKLLRVLQERQVLRLGSRKPIPVNVRLVAATNVDLERAVEAGHFRRDLYYRLSVAPVDLPPLRERRGDIMPLARHFIEVYSKKLELEHVKVSKAAEQRLLAYDWPGNIRELENVIHFALIMCSGNELQPDNLRLPGLSAGSGSDNSPQAQLQSALKQLLGQEQPALLERIEEQIIVTAFDFCGRNQVRTAKKLDISRNILRAQLKRFGLLDKGSEQSRDGEADGDGDEAGNSVGDGPAAGHPQRLAEGEEAWSTTASPAQP